MIVWPGLRRSVSAISRLFNSAAFDAPLTHSAVPTRAASGTTATFTRATASKWKNNDGYMVTGVAGEIGFVGARRVRNRFTKTEALTDAAWTKLTTTVTAGQDDPNGGLTAFRLEIVVGGGIYQSFGAAGEVCTESWYVKSNTGASQNIRFNVGGTTSANIAVTTTWQRLQATATATGTIHAILGDGANAADILVWHPQSEDVTAQTTQTAGEYVSVGVESAPYYHGSMVDGVKCFHTTLAGDLIPASTLLGYSAQGARTNLCLQSNAFTTTWVNDGLTPVQDAIGPDGGTTAWTLDDNAGGAVERIYQTGITLTAATYTMSVFIKKTSTVPGANSYPLIFATQGANIALATIDPVNGTATVWTTYVGPATVTSSARCTSYNSTYWRVELTFLATAAAWTVAILPAAAAQGQSTGVESAAGVGSHVFANAQVELGSFATSYIPTTTAAVTRNADVLTYPSAGNVDGATGWCYAEATPYANNADTNNYYIADSAGASVPLYSNGVDGNAVIYDQTNAAIKGGTTFVNTPFKCASTWGGSSISVTSRGQSPASAAFDGDMGPFTSLYIGVTSGGSSLWGSIKNVRIGQRQLSASELQAITA